MEEYKRNCPKCGKLKIYKSKLGWKRAVDENKVCMSCTKTGMKYSDEINKKKGRAGEKNAFYGKIHSIDSKQKIRESLLNPNSDFQKWINSDEAKKLFQTYSEKMIGEGNHFYGKMHSKEVKERMSTIKTEQIASGELNVLVNAWGNKGSYKSIKTNLVEFYHSELELVRMKMLDSDNDVIHWTKKHGICIPYLYKGNIKNYVPDFLIINSDDSKTLEETKGYDSKAKLKKEALKKYCKENNFTYNWINQHELNEYKQWRNRKRNV
jgi:hypothetical protein